MYWYVVLFLTALVLLFKIRRYLCKRKEQKRRIKIGKIGEQETIRELKKIHGHKRILHNLYVPTGKGTTEIDVVVLHEKGIFVIENKNYVGAIYGNETNVQWNQVYRKHGEQISRQFYNPVKQNQTHIRYLKKFLTSFDFKHISADQVQKTPYISVITFNDKANLQQIHVNSADVLVSESRNVQQKLDKKLHLKQQVWKRKQIEELYRRLRPLENPGKRVKKQHIQQIQKRRKSS